MLDPQLVPDIPKSTGNNYKLFSIIFLLSVLNIGLFGNSLSLKSPYNALAESSSKDTALPIQHNLRNKTATAGNTIASPETAQKVMDGNTEKIGVIATVNGDPITITDILEVCGAEEARLPHIYKGKQLEEEIKKLRLKTLDMLIDRKLVYQEFKDKGYKLPKNFVENNLDYLIQVFNVENRQELERELKKQGSSMAEFRKNAYENAAVNALINDVCYRDVFITPREVYDYYKKNQNQFSSPEKIHLQILMLDINGIHKNDLNKLLGHLKNTFKNKDPKEFSNSVLLYSEGPNVENGGDIGWVDSSKLKYDFKKQMVKAKINDIVGPVKSQGAYYFLRVAGIEQGKKEAFKDVREQIESKLSAQKKESNYKAYIAELRKKAYIKKYL